MSKNDDDARLTAALAYAQRGWRVLPLHGIVQGRCTCLAGGACLTPGKHPLLRRWVEQASTVPAQIQHWWRYRPYANVGIATGFASGLVVVDVDPRHGGHIAWEELLAHYGALPLSQQVLTGGDGTHDYLWCAEALAGIDLAHGIQFQAEGRLVVPHRVCISQGVATPGKPRMTRMISRLPHCPRRSGSGRAPISTVMTRQGETSCRWSRPHRCTG